MLDSDKIDAAIVRMHRQGAGLVEIHRTLKLDAIRLKEVARVIAKSEMTIKFNHSELRESYLIIPSLMNYDFKMK